MSKPWEAFSSRCEVAPVRRMENKDTLGHSGGLLDLMSSKPYIQRAKPDFLPWLCDLEKSLSLSDFPFLHL